MYTVGHSTRTLNEFLTLFRAYGIEALVDVRRWPTSRRSPHFSGESLEKALAEDGIRYVWMGEALGGYRREGLGEGSPNKGWSSGGYRNYADHALSEEFQRALKKLHQLSETCKIAIMCAEKHYWRCHRRIISDHLVARGIRVVHIVDMDQTRRHRLTFFAVIRDGTVVYPPSGEQITLDRRQ